MILLFMIFFLFGNMKFKPFLSQDLNQMENLSLICSNVVIYCQLYFISFDNGASNANPCFTSVLVHLNNNTRLLLLLIILFTNVFFISFLFYRMTAQFRENLLRKHERIYFIFCLCCRKKQLEAQKAKYIEQSEKDLLETIFNESNFLFNS